MHYLEDYLELLDPLREIMREKLTLMRENDLKIQAEMTQLEDDSSEFLHNYRLYQKQSPLSPTKSKINVHCTTMMINKESNLNEQLTPEQLVAQQQKQTEYNKLVQRHEQLLQDTTTKITLANESHDFVERYFKKLEDDLNKFKMELEADYSGLTEKLEKRFASEGFNEDDDRTGENSVLDPSLLDMEPLFDPFDDILMSNSLTDDYTNQSTLSYLASQSRRLSTGLTPCNSLALLNRKQHQRLLSNPSVSSRGRKRLQGTSSSSNNNISKRKRNIIRHSFLNDSHHLLPHSDSDESSSNNILNSDYFNLNHQTSSVHLFDDETNGSFDSSNFTGQTTIDERRYCFCNEMSYGDMIACDNPTCCREWFHYPCVGIVTPPKGKWFCTECAQIIQQQAQISTVKRASTS